MRNGTDSTKITPDEDPISRSKYSTNYIHSVEGGGSSTEGKQRQRGHRVEALDRERDDR